MSEQFEQVQLEAAEKIVQGRPGVTAQEMAGLIPRPGGQAGVSRDRALALLRTLEQDGKVIRQAGQASVGFYPAQEDSHAE
jgi:hypothetical protein